MDTYFAAPLVLERMRSGPMAPYLGTLAADLQSQDYSRKSIRRQLRNADSFGSWLNEQNLAVDLITEEAVSRYVGGMHRSTREGCAKGYRPHNARGLPRLLDLFRSANVLPPVVSCSAMGHPFRLAASCTASKIRENVPHRHRFPASPALISSWLGFGFFLRRAVEATTKPGV